MRGQWFRTTLPKKVSLNRRAAEQRVHSQLNSAFHDPEVRPLITASFELDVETKDTIRYVEKPETGSLRRPSPCADQA